MDSCSRPVEFMSIYLFQNGVACNPEKLRVKRNEIEKPFTKTGKCFYYQASVLYTFEGEKVTCFGVQETLAFVLVPLQDSFICANYGEAFENLMRKRDEQKRKLEAKGRCKSAPSIPSVKQSCNDNSRRRSKEHQHCVTTEKYPCCDKDSDQEFEPRPPTPGPRKGRQHCITDDKYPCSDDDDEDEEEVCPPPRPKPRNCGPPPCPPPKPKRDKSCPPKPRCPPQPPRCPPPKPRCEVDSCDSRPATPAAPPKPEKQGFMAKFCPCCVTKSKYRASCLDLRPGSCEPRNAKLTQTTKEDFKRAQRCLKNSMRAEKRRKRMYGKSKRASDKLSCVEEKELSKRRGGPLNECMSERDREKAEAQYRKARELYRQKRRKMEEKINNAMEKEKRKQKPC